MKKISKFLMAAAFLALTGFFASCSTEPKDEIISGTESLTQSDIVIKGSDIGGNYAFKEYSLSAYANKSVIIDFSAEMKVTNNGSKAERLMWQINTSDYPVIAEHTFEKGVTDFITVQGVNKDPVSLGPNNALYLSTYKTDTANLIIEIRNIKYTVKYFGEGPDPEDISWIDESVPSLYETYKDDFNYVGLACEYSTYNGIKELVDDNVCKGLKKHGNTITMGNEFKPDGFFGYMWSGSGKTMVDFKASNGKTIKVPTSLSYDTIDRCLAQCKKHGLQMRGHVLVWHSQTPDNFFAEGYVAKYNGNLISNIVDKDTMTARQEWYIKTVLNHVADWEAKNNSGKHIIWAWDVVNEAMADDAGRTYTGTSQNWLRGSTAKTINLSPSNGGSRWYQVYGSDEFIINAFRFANAYAPADVKLCYNDYNEYMNYSEGYKTDAICHLVDEIKAGAAETINGKSVAPRIDAIGMQSHVGIDWPGVSGYENAIKAFLKKGVDIHVTELDIADGTRAATASLYKDYFTLFQKYGNKSTGSNKIECVTIWGINNKTSWIYKGSTKYPLLFDDFKTTRSFRAVISAKK